MSDARPPLSATAIVEAAVVLADGDGVGALTMRKLAASLGYEVMSLYNHVANKAELLGLMAEAVATEVDEADVDGEPLLVVRRLALSMRAALAAHPWSAELWLRHLPGPARTANMELLLATLAESGLPPDLAHHGFHAVMNHVVGYTLQDIGMAAGMDDPERTAEAYLAGLSADDNPHTKAHVQYHLDGHATSSFELVLDLILDGLVRLAEAR